MLLVSQHGEWETWIRFFLGGIREQSLDVIHRSKQLFALKREYAEKVRAGSGSSNLALMVDQLFKTPAVYLSDVTEILRLTKPGAQNIIDKLIDLDIMVEVTGKKRGRLYLARGIVATYTRDIAVPHMAASAGEARAPSR